MAQKFNIIALAQNLIDYIYQATSASPNKYKHDLPSRIRDLSLYILELIIEANQYSSSGVITNPNERKRLQSLCLIKLKLLESLSEIAIKHQIVTNKQFEQIIIHSENLYSKIEAWILSDSKR